MSNYQEINRYENLRYEIKNYLLMNDEYMICNSYDYKGNCCEIYELNKLLIWIRFKIIYFIQHILVNFYKMKLL